MTVQRLDQNPIHLGLGAVARVQPPMDGDMGWYMAYAERTAGEGTDIRPR